jgi:hypothetical protein
VFPYGTHDYSYRARADGEAMEAFVRNYDGDESATVTVSVLRGNFAAFLSPNKDGSVTYGYTVTTSIPVTNPDAAYVVVELLYLGPDGNPVGAPIASHTLLFNPGAIGRFTVSASQLSAPPRDATHLAAAVDRGGQLPESDKTDNTAAVTLPPNLTPIGIDRDDQGLNLNYFNGGNGGARLPYASNPDVALVWARGTQKIPGPQAVLLVKPMAKEYGQQTTHVSEAELRQSLLSHPRPQGANLLLVTDYNNEVKESNENDNALPLSDTLGPMAVLNQEQLDFGNVSWGQSVEMSFEVKNVGDQPLHVSRLSIGAANDYSIIGATSFDVASGASQVVHVRFAPTYPHAGQLDARLTISSDDLFLPAAEVRLTGEAKAAVPSIVSSNVDPVHTGRLVVQYHLASSTGDVQDLRGIQVVEKLELETKSTLNSVLNVLPLPWSGLSTVQRFSGGLKTDLPFYLAWSGNDLTYSDNHGDYSTMLAHSLWGHLIPNGATFTVKQTYLWTAPWLDGKYLPIAGGTYTIVRQIVPIYESRADGTYRVWEQTTSKGDKSFTEVLFEEKVGR